MKSAVRLIMVFVAAVALWTMRPVMAQEAVMPKTGATPVEGGQKAEAAHEETAELVPQSPEGQKQALLTAIWVIVIFLILLAILYPTAWKGVLAGLKAREDRIRKDIADAEATRTKAEATLAEYNKQLTTAEDRVRELLVKAQADGERLAATIRDNATKEAETIKNKALSDIEAARNTAVSQIHDEAAELSTAIAEKIIRRSLNADDQRDLVRASLEEFGAGGN